MDRIVEHGARCAALVAGFHAARPQAFPSAFGKQPRICFGAAKQTARHKMDVRSFDRVLPKPRPNSSPRPS